MRSRPGARRGGAAAATGRPLLAAVLPLLVAASLLSPLRAEDAAERAERFDGLVESLNAPSSRRGRALEQIHAELRGADGREMREMLLEALFRKNTLIVQGAVEALAMLGDAADIDNLDALLATSGRLEVRNLVLRLLPAFCLGFEERARFAYIQYASGYDRVANPAVLAPLRRPPLNRRGRLDQRQERIQSRVARRIAGQFDPVGAALPFLDDRLYGGAARSAILHYVGGGLGGDTARWAAIWEGQRGNLELAEPFEVEEIRLNALHSLSDMGAEGLPDILAAFDRLLDGVEGDILPQAAFETLATMCACAYELRDAIAAMNFGAEDAVPAENWRKRRLASAVDTAVFAVGRALAHIEGRPERGSFSAAVACLGAALSYPPSFPDPGARLPAAREAGLAALERLLLRPDLSRERRADVAAALGAVGAVRSVSVLVGILNSPYASPDFGQDGARMAEAVVDGLRAAAVGPHDGAAEARRTLLGLLRDDRVFEPLRPGTPPVGLGHMVLWRLQRLARTNDISFDPEFWRVRLGW